MKLFLKSIFKFILAFSLIIIIQLLFFKYLLFYNVDFHLSKDKTTLILGDSQTETALNDSIIKNSVNLSKAGDPLYFNYIKLKKILKNNSQIKTLVLGFSPSNLISKGFYEVPKMKSKYKTYFYLIDFKDYGDLIDYNFEGFIRGATGLESYLLKSWKIIITKDITKIGIGGFRPISYNISKLDDDILLNNSILPKNEPDQIAVRYFYRIIEICQNNDIELIVINTPLHSSLSDKQINHKRVYDQFMSKINRNVLKWDYEYYNLDDFYFYDDNHLNLKGAEIFSHYINNKLRIETNN